MKCELKQLLQKYNAKNEEDIDNDIASIIESVYSQHKQDDLKMYNAVEKILSEEEQNFFSKFLIICQQWEAMCTHWKQFLVCTNSTNDVQILFLNFIFSIGGVVIVFCGLLQKA